MKFKNISIGDSVQIKKSMCHIEFKAKQVCEVIDLDPTDKHGFDVLIQGKNCLDWVNHKYLKKPINREPEPKLRRVDQSVFDGMPSEYKWVARDRNGDRYAYAAEPHARESTGVWVNNSDLYARFMDSGYDDANWQNSLIEREKVELTGSDLCRAMLERGDKFVLCFVSDFSDDRAASQGDRINLMTHIKGDCFYAKSARWSFVVPINQQTGEPLSAADVGL